MGFWINNFLEFERKQKQSNRLILNLRYISAFPEEERNVKVYYNTNIIVPSNFLTSEKAEKIIEELNNDEILKEFPYRVKEFGKFRTLEIEVPNNPSVLHKLPKPFQRGNYDKLLRFSGFFPERKITLDSKLLEEIGNRDEIEISNLSQLDFGEFLSESELKELPYLVIDIEKPLWKHYLEKEAIKMKEKVLRNEKAFERKKEFTEEEFLGNLKRKRTLTKLERMLKYSTEGVGEIDLSDERFRANVSFVGTIWGRNGEIVKELYALDPKREIEQDEFNGFSILKFDTERDLVRGLMEKIKERKPVVSFGHNQVYDITQLRFAADDGKIMFDPSVKEIKPKRDFVRSFLQRLREDLIYIDTLWMGKIFYPYLNQKRFGTNHKLESLAQFLDIDFSKSLTHEELREVELRRLGGKTEEIRKEAAKQMVSYSCSDLDVTKNIIERINPFSLLVSMKKALPFCTYSEIAFSPNCVNKAHEYKHLSEIGNLPFYGYKLKERQDQIHIFKKRFPSMKEKRLRASGLEKAEIGEYSDVVEYYLSLEEEVKDIAFSIYPPLRKAYEEMPNTENRFAFLQYLRAFMKEVFTDYYFASREKKVYLNSLKNMGIEDMEAFSYFDILSKKVDASELDSLVGSFRFLKNHFRSIYAILTPEETNKLLLTKSNVERIHFPKIMEEDADLFLLRENAPVIRKTLDEFNKKNLFGFLKNFESFEEISERIGENIKDLSMPEGIFYSYIYDKRFRESSRCFSRKYSINLFEIYGRISKVYSDLSSEIKEKNLKFLDNIGDYIIIQGKTPLNRAIKVRELENFVVR